MQVTVRLYAQLRERLPRGERQVTLELPEGATVLDLADRLGLGQTAVEIMVNNTGAHYGLKVGDGDVVSFFPALAGG
ncbi:MAG: MoaD/ThiS family protein [Armatimonadetes bacterium]|nr:MoaD/ThiS family protein [Armatimonadota bacterium]